MSAHKTKLKNGKEVWVAKFRYTDYKDDVIQKKKQGFKTKREALEYERDFLDKMNPSINMQFSILVEKYYEIMALKLKPTTMENKKHLIDSKILPYFGKKKISEINNGHINEWHLELSKLGYKKTYIRSIRNQICAIFNFAMRNHKLPENPVLSAENMGQKNADKMDFYTLDEFNQFISSFEDNSTLNIIYKILFWSGIRLGELLALKPNDFNFEKMTLRVDENLQVVKKEKILQKPKTKTSIRTIDIPDNLALDIQKYIASINDIKKDDLIFNVSKSHLGNHMKKGAEKAGVKRIRVHDLRHSNASLQIDLDVNLLVIAQRLGHHSLKQLDETYGHIYKNRYREVGIALNNLYK